MIIRSAGTLWWAFAFRRWRKKIDASIRHLAGPGDVPSGSRNLVATCLVKNGAFHLETFLAHHRHLGLKHFVLLDNGSSDATLEIASQQEDVTLLQCELPFGQAKHALRAWLLETFGVRGWTLMVDIDERFDYPCRAELGLGKFLEYLDRRKFSAVPAHLLDLFAEGPIDTWPASGEEMIERCVWYDLSSLEKSIPKIWFNRHSGPPIGTFHGGIRQKAFGIRPNLTKFPLIHWGRGARPYLNNSHFFRCGHIADLSCLLKHYKFTAAFGSQVDNAVREGQYFNNSSEYRIYRNVLRKSGGLDLRTPEARQYGGDHDLIEEGFLDVSKAFLNFVERQEEEGTA